MQLQTHMSYNVYNVYSVSLISMIRLTTTTDFLTDTLRYIRYAIRSQNFLRCARSCTELRSLHNFSGTILCLSFGFGENIMIGINNMGNEGYDKELE